MASVPTGTTFSLGSAYSAPQSTTVVTNAVEAVVTATAHGYANGDFVEMTSGWGRLNRMIFRIKSVAANTFVLEGADTTYLPFFPAGTGLGSVRKVSAFTQIVQVLSVNFSGGDPNNVEFKYVESDVKGSINDGFGAVTGTLELDADSISTPGYLAARALTNVQTDTCIKMTTRNGSIVLYPCTVALNESVKIQDGNINSCTMAVNCNGRIVRYAA